jgi:Rieske Fe-S protein
MVMTGPMRCRQERCRPLVTAMTQMTRMTATGLAMTMTSTTMTATTPTASTKTVTDTPTDPTSCDPTSNEEPLRGGSVWATDG